MIISIAWREFRNLFLSPLAWTVLAVIQLILAWVFFTQVDAFFTIQAQLTTLPNAPGVVDLIVSPLLEVTSIVLLMVTPLLTMRLLSDEQRNGTLSLLLSAPISNTEIALGKYLGMAGFMLLLVGLISLMPLSLLSGSELDLGKLAAGLLALLLLLCAFSAAGLYLSALTASPVIAAVSTFGLLLLLWIIERNAGGNAQADTVISYLSLLGHFGPMLRGIINTADLAYFAIFIVTFLALTVRQLDAQRLQG